MLNTVIKIENVSKQYRLGVWGTSTLRDEFSRSWAKLRGKPDPTNIIGDSNNLNESDGNNYVWALKNINLEINKGDVLGIIGKNGSGKSTLLKILSQVTNPTSGNIKVKGRIASLLEVGTGMHPEMTGKENIFLNGAILGMTKLEISNKFDEIVEFSGIAKYINTPIKRYSSGMRVRLGFAIAAFLEPDILIVDEVLAVGDAEFQKKAIGKMQDISKGEGRTVLFVSHNLGSVKTLCTRTILLNNGNIYSEGAPEEMISKYLGLGNKPLNNKTGVWTGVEISQNNNASEITLKSAEILNEKGVPSYTFLSTESIQIKVKYSIKKAIKSFRLQLRIISQNDSTVFTSYEDSSVIYDKEEKPGNYISICTIPGNLLNSKTYSILIGASQVKIKNLIPYTQILSFNVIDSTSDSLYPQGLEGVIKPKLKWCKKMS